MPRGRGFAGRGRNFSGAGFGSRAPQIGAYTYGGMQYPVWGGGRGNPYPFCRFYPWLPRRWWAYGVYPPPAQPAYPYNMPVAAPYPPRGAYTPVW
jgi:hypothetical protein